MTTNPEVLRLARQICAEAPGVNALQKQAYLNGAFDIGSSVTVAIAAIERTTELAMADVLEMKKRYGKAIGTGYEEGSCDMGVRIQGRLLAYEHLRQSEKDNSDAD